jgi:hypothetical protein
MIRIRPDLSTCSQFCSLERRFADAEETQASFNPIEEPVATYKQPRSYAFGAPWRTHEHSSVEIRLSGD